MSKKQTDQEPPEISLWELHLTHPGLSDSVAGAICASAAVCLDRHHVPPTHIDVEVDERPHRRVLLWRKPTRRDRSSNNNNPDATRDGAYAVALRCIERVLDLVTVGRAEELTGSDWYVAPPGRGVDDDGAPDLDDPAVVRLEVGGHDDRSSLPYELKEKVRQLIDGESDKPGVAAVVGFKKCRILIATSVPSGQVSH